MITVILVISALVLVGAFWRYALKGVAIVTAGVMVLIAIAAGCIQMEPIG